MTHSVLELLDREAAFQQLFEKDVHLLLPQSGSQWYEERMFETVSGEMSVALLCIPFFAQYVKQKHGQCKRHAKNSRLAVRPKKQYPGVLFFRTRSPCPFSCNANVFEVYSVKF